MDVPRLIDELRLIEARFSGVPVQRLPVLRRDARGSVRRRGRPEGLQLSARPRGRSAH